MPVPLAPAVRDNRFAQSLFTPLPGRYDRLAEILSMGQNARWRRTMIDKIMPADDGTVLDVASGTAGVALQVTGRSKARVVGVDLTEQMLRQGQRNVAAAAQRDRIAPTNGRGEQLPFADASFDALTFTYLLRYVADPQATLTELARVVKPGGRAASLEFLEPPSPFWRPLWWLYTRLVLPVAGLLTGGPAWSGSPGASARPAYYAARPGGWRDWWTLLHPPYTAWHLAYVVIGACLAPRVSLSALVATLIAFFLAVGLAAHALDELNGRPLQTRISSPALIAV